MFPPTYSLVCPTVISAKNPGSEQPEGAGDRFMSTPHLRTQERTVDRPSEQKLGITTSTKTKKRTASEGFQ